MERTSDTVYKYIADPYASADSKLPLSSFALLTLRTITNKAAVIRITIPKTLPLTWDKQTKTYNTNCKKPLSDFEPTPIVNIKGAWRCDWPNLMEKPIQTWKEILQEDDYYLIPEYGYTGKQEYEDWMQMKKEFETKNKQYAEEIKSRIANGEMTEEELQQLSKQTLKNVLLLYIKDAQK